MPKRRNDDDDDEGGNDDECIPLPIQTFLWRQTSPFIRPKISRLQDAAAMEQREACKSFEKVLVQNIQFGLSPSLTEAIKSISRWKLIQSSLPHVMHCCAALLYSRKHSSFDKLSAAETKLLYTLHWILIDAAEECAESEEEENRRPIEHYLLPITTIQVFIYLFAPLMPYLKQSDFLTSFRLENGHKIWSPLFAHQHPDIPSFTAQAKPKRNILHAVRRDKKALTKFGDVFIGAEKDDLTAELTIREATPTPSLVSTEICSQTLNQTPTPTPMLSPTPGQTPGQTPAPTPGQTPALTPVPSELKRKTESSGSPMKEEPFTKQQAPIDVKPKILSNPSMATYLDIAIVRCLFTSQWLEEGIDWALEFVLNRLKSIDEMNVKPKQRTRSQSLPTPKPEPFVFPVAPKPALPKIEVPEESPFDLLGKAGFTERRSSFSGLPGLGNIGLAGLGVLIGSGITGMDRRGSERVKTPKKSKKEKKEKDKEKEKEKDKEKSSHDGDQISNKLKEKDKSDAIFKSKELKVLIPPRPKSSIGMYEEVNLIIKQEELIAGVISSEMQRGSSMPSLHLLVDKLPNDLTLVEIKERFITKGELKPTTSPLKRSTSQTHSIPNPIITITEHSPASSVQFFISNQESNDSPRNDSPLIDVQLTAGQPAITRSQTDTKLNYFSDNLTEAPASTFYVTKTGQISLVVILKAIHSITLRDSVCSLRVCKSVFSIVNYLIKLNVLPKFIAPIDTNEADGTGTGTGTVRKNGTETPGSLSCTQATILTDHEEKDYNQGMRRKIKVNPDNDELSIHHLIMDTCFRLIKHLGCPHGCGEAHREPVAVDLRKSIGSTLLYLFNLNEQQFEKYLDEFVMKRANQEILDIFHAFFGFCYEQNLQANLITPLNQQARRSIINSNQINNQTTTNDQPKTGYATNFGAGFNNISSKGLEGIVVNFVFKPFVSKMTKIQKDLKLQENMSLYCEIRQFIAYVRDNHGGTFRKVALSALIDSLKLLNQAKDKYSMKNQNEDFSPVQDDEQQYGNETGKGGSKSLFFRKKSSGMKKTQSNQSIHDSTGESGGLEWTPPIPGIAFAAAGAPVGLGKIHRSASPRLSISDDDASALFSQKNQSKESKSDQKGFHFNWFKSKESSHQTLFPFSGDLHGTSSPNLTESQPDKLVRKSSFSRIDDRHRDPAKSSGQKLGHVGATFVKARKRMEDQFKFVFGKSKSKHGTYGEHDGPMDLSRRSSFDFDKANVEGLLLLKEAKLVSLPAVKNGMLRFQFLLESCSPGTLPDAPLVAAMLDLKAPIVARAAFYLECANFVHRCNRGLWPNWMRVNFNLFRPSGPPPSVKSGTNSVIRGRASHVMQRIAGRAFYQWAEALGLRLEELLKNNINLEKSMQSNMTDDNKRKQLRSEDDDEDFLDEATCNPLGDECPFALKIIACQLLLEITAFLRETHQYLPTRVSRSSAKNVNRGSYIEPKLFTANRRWSMALSSLGYSQASAHSLMSLAGQSAMNQEQISSNPITSSHHGERRISFVLQEADGEDDSRSSSISYQPEEQEERKRMSQVGSTTRTSLLKRSTFGSGSGSFKRRSIKLKKGERKTSTQKHKSLLEDGDEEIARFKRADSLRSRRKVSGFSEKSDTSDRISGDESPGIMSDDGMQFPDQQEKTDQLDADDTELTTNIPWLKILNIFNESITFDCSHFHYCKPNCYRRLIRSCSRLIKSVKKVYIDDHDKHIDLIALRLFEDKEDAMKKEKKLKKIVTASSSSPIKRKTSVGHNVDKMVDRADGYGHSVHSSTTYLAHVGVGTNLDVESGNLLTNQDLDPRRTFLEVASYKSQIRKDENITLKYINLQVKNPFHSLISMLLKGALILTSSTLNDLMSFSWNLLLESDQQLSSTAAVSMIICALKIPEKINELLDQELNHENVHRKLEAINKFYIIWKARYQCWPRLEEGAHLYLKVPPPAIEFTLPSPKIALDSISVVDPPYMPVARAKLEEVTISQDPTIQKSFVAATKTRRKQQIELVTKALQEEEEKLKSERENFRISSVPVTFQAAYEPALFHTIEEHDDDDDESTNERPSTHHIQAAQSLFPSSLCTASVTIINLLDDSKVDDDGSSVYEVAYKVIWHCLVEDPALFLRNLLEKLTKGKHSMIFQILRRLIRFMPKLPAQAAYTLYNYLIGFVMFHVRAPVEGSQEIISSVLSILWLVVPSVHGLFLKDLKQILRKEQCDASLLITANVPSAKKIIVHGPDASAIPSQFPIHDDTQFSQILLDSIDFFGIDESQGNEYFLVDTKTNEMHNLNSFVRDFYFFKRSQYPQISLVHKNPNEAFFTLQKQAFTLQFVELGKALMSLSIVKSHYMPSQRVLFLHEELMKLPTFPRKALESYYHLYDGPMGKEVIGMDTMHKIGWTKLVSRMFEVTSGFFAQSGDLHLFLNLINGIMVLHCEDASILRFCCGTIINAAIQFKNIFAYNGYLLVMPTILRIYSNHQTNGLLCRTIEFVCKQFYILHRKPFILQTFGSIAPILDMDFINNFGDASKVQPRAFFQLLQSLSQYIVDPLDILELVEAEKPLKALDFCYQMDPETLTVLDAISLCVTAVAYSPDSQRGSQMLIVLEAILPLHLKHMQGLTTKKETGGPRAELQMIHSISACMKTLIINSEALTRNFTGPQRAIDLRGSSIKNAKGACSPQFDIDEDSHSKFMPDSYSYPTRNQQKQSSDSSDGETLRTEFRRPRDTLLTIVADFLTKSTSRLHDLSKKLPDLHQKGSSYDQLLDVKCHLRLAEIAHSLLKMAPYDPLTMGCKGLVRYMNEILPNSEWRQEQMRPALIMVLRRLDKTFIKIAKKSVIKRSTDWEAAKRLLKGVYLTFLKHPYIVHLPHLKSLISVCQNIVMGEQSHQPNESSSALPTWTSPLAQTSSTGFTSVAVRLIAMQMLQLGESQTLETVCSGCFSTPEKSQICLLNMIYPMCIRISGGLREAPKLRQNDINFILNVTLQTLNLSSTKQQISQVKGSDSSSVINHSMSQTSLHQVGFLGLKILIVCFERQLTIEWYKISKSVRDYGMRIQGTHLWNFFDFIVTYRTPLFLLLFPIIKQKYLNKICENEQEYYYQQQIKDKLEGNSLPMERSKGLMLVNLMSEMKQIKEDLVNRKSAFDDRNKSIIPDPSSFEKEKTRLSFGFTSMVASQSKTSNVSSTGSNAQQINSPEKDADSKDGTPTSKGSHSLLRGFSFRGSQTQGGAGESRIPPRGLSVKLPSSREGGRKLVERFLRRTSYPNPQEEGPGNKENQPADQPGHTVSEPRLYRKSTLHIKKRGSRRSAGSGAGGSASASSEILPEGVTLEEESKQESMVSLTESTGSMSPSSGTDDQRKDRHRLQRQKAQSRKTFRFKTKVRRTEGRTEGGRDEHEEETLLKHDDHDDVMTTISKPNETSALLLAGSQEDDSQPQDNSSHGMNIPFADEDIEEEPKE